MSGAQDLFKIFTKNLTFDKKKHHSQLSKLGWIKSSETSLEENTEEPHIVSNNPDDPSQDDELVNKKKVRSKSREEAAALNRHIALMTKLRKDNCIHTKGADIPDLVTEFNQLTSRFDVSDKLVSNLLEQGFSEPTPIQMQCWPLLLAGREVIATAPTGSGKTAAFLLPILHQLRRPRALGFRAVVVSPTRELADQTHREAVFLSKGTNLKVHLIDKVDKVLKRFGPKSSQKFDVLVTTPNRLVFILNQDPPLINLENVEWLIMDECDRLFEGGKSGFRDQLSIIYQACTGPKVRRGFFSATHSFSFQLWCEENFDNLANVTVGQRNTASKDVEQSLVFCGEEEGKLYALRDLLRKGFEPPCLVFVQSKERARQLFKELVYDDYTVDAIHSERTQKQREDCVRAFREKKVWILICTELMSRGIDFKGVNLVINYDFPPTLVSYIHRIGRTGRALRKGKAVTFWTQADQVNLGWMARNIKASGGEVPEWMLNLRKLAPHEKKAAQRTKDRGFVSEGAKLTQMEADRKKKKKISRKLDELRAAGENQTEESLKLKGQLHRLVAREKLLKNKAASQSDRDEVKRKRARERSNESRKKKAQKTE